HVNLDINTIRLVIWAVQWFKAGRSQWNQFTGESIGTNAPLQQAGGANGISSLVNQQSPV
ncbi:hypothetical protein TrispH2_002426, partial [Trichoplax sp. H2]